MQSRCPNACCHAVIPYRSNGNHSCLRLDCFAAFSALHVHASCNHDVAVAFIGTPEILEKDNGLEVDLQDPPSSNPIGLENASQQFANGSDGLGLARRLDDGVA